MNVDKKMFGWEIQIFQTARSAFNSCLIMIAKYVSYARDILYDDVS